MVPYWRVRLISVIKNNLDLKIISVLDVHNLIIERVMSLAWLSSTISTMMESNFMILAVVIRSQLFVRVSSSSLLNLN